MKHISVKCINLSRQGHTLKAAVSFAITNCFGVANCSFITGNYKGICRHFVTEVYTIRVAPHAKDMELKLFYSRNNFKTVILY